MKRIVSVCVMCLLAASAAQAGPVVSYWVPIGTVSGGVAVYYNTLEQGSVAENPLNQAYLRAQFNNSMTQTNGARFTFVPELHPVFGEQGQFGFDLIVEALTNNSNVPTPVLNAYNNVNNTIAGRVLAGPVLWAINDYKSDVGIGSGPDDADTSIINSLIRGGDGTFTLGSVVPITGGFQVAFSATLVSDGTIYWYNPELVDRPMSVYRTPAGEHWSGDFRASGILTYLVANDSTPGMDFYAGDIVIEAHVIPEPATLGLLALGGVLLRRRIR